MGLTCDIYLEDLEVVDSAEKIPPFDGMTAYALTGAKAMMQQGYSGKNIKVVVLDSGLHFNHPLFGRVSEMNNSFVDYTGMAIDDSGHGTHVASTYVLGMPDVEVVPYKVFSPLGGDFDVIADALNAIADRDDIDIVNCSFGSPRHNAKLQAALEKCSDSGKFIVCSAGNTGKEQERYPSMYDCVTSVGAVDIYKNLAYFSTSHAGVDVCQAGVNVWGADYNSDGYVQKSGTSMATPMYGVVAGYLIEKYKDRYGKRPDPKFIHKMTKLNAIDLGIPGLDISTGAGFCSLDPTKNIIKMKIGSRHISINNTDHIIDNVVTVDNGVSMVPTRLLNEKDAKRVTYKNDTKEILIV